MRRTGCGRNCERSARRMKEHRNRRPSIGTAQTLDGITSDLVLCDTVKTACRLLFSIKRSMFLEHCREHACSTRGGTAASGQSSSDSEGFYTLTSRVFDLYHRLLLPYGSHSRRFEGDSPSIKCSLCSPRYGIGLEEAIWPSDIHGCTMSTARKRFRTLSSYYGLTLL